jgi:methionine biosynthesis protein MetW
VNTELDKYNRYWRERRDTKYTPVRPRHIIIANYIMSHQEGSASVLDLGCGEGHILQKLPSHKFFLYGCDISRIPINMIQDNGILVRQCDLNHEWPDFTPTAYDYIIASELLEHMQSPETLLTNINAHMSPSSTFLCTIPNVWWWKYLWPRLHGKRPNYDPTHCHFWTIPGFKKLLAARGFVVTESRPTIVQLPKNRYMPKAVKGIAFRIPGNRYLLGEQWLFVCRKKAAK